MNVILCHKGYKWLFIQIDIWILFLNSSEGFGSASIQLLLPLLQATFDTENISFLNTLNLARQKPCHILL